MASLIEIQHDVWHMRSGFSIAQTAGASNLVAFPGVPPYASEDAATYVPPPTWTPSDSSKEVAVLQHTKPITDVVAIDNSSSIAKPDTARVAQTLATEVEAFLGGSTEACDEFGVKSYASRVLVQVRLVADSYVVLSFGGTISLRSFFASRTEGDRDGSLG